MAYALEGKLVGACTCKAGGPCRADVHPELSAFRFQD